MVLTLSHVTVPLRPCCPNSLHITVPQMYFYLCTPNCEKINTDQSNKKKCLEKTWWGPYTVEL